MLVNEAVQWNGNRFVDTFFEHRCPQRILMVTDERLSFGTGELGLSAFVAIVSRAGHSVATAHRDGAGPTTIPGAYNFARAARPVTRANYDQLWLFGWSVTPLDPSEQCVIARFMKSGGGVFATGDRATIGHGMGACIPRVRGMREWAGVPMAHPGVPDPSADQVKQLDDAADATYQRIYPVLFSSGGPKDVPSSWNVHPVLRDPSGAVDVLPHDPHQSECLAPTPTAGAFAGVEEWPAPTGGGARIGARVVATSISAGRFITDVPKPRVTPRCFDAISAYDGDAAGVGRVVCDATWRHYVNVNLSGAGAGPEPGTVAPRMHANDAPVSEHLKIQRYYLNTVRWLAPVGRRTCWRFLQLAVTRFDCEELELSLPRPHPCPWDPLVAIGRAAEDAVVRRWGPGSVADILDDLLEATDAAPALRKLLKARREDHDTDSEAPAASFVPVDELRRALLGSVVNVLAHQVPADEETLAALFDHGHDELARELVCDGIRGAEPAIDHYLAHGLDRAVTLVRAIRDRK